MQSGHTWVFLYESLPDTKEIKQGVSLGGYGGKMGIVELALIGVGLSMDAFAASVCKGLSMKKVDVRYGLVLAVFFGGFQALMPLLGWLLGSRFQQYITSIDHWIAFALLLVLGVKMIIDAVREEDEAVCQSDRMEMNLKEIVMLAVATSIDALAVGDHLRISVCEDPAVSIPDRMYYFWVFHRRRVYWKCIRQQV